MHHLQKCQGRENVGGGGGPKDTVDAKNVGERISDTCGYKTLSLFSS